MPSFKDEPKFKKQEEAIKQQLKQFCEDSPRESNIILQVQNGLADSEAQLQTLTSGRALASGRLTRKMSSSTYLGQSQTSLIRRFTVIKEDHF